MVESLPAHLSAWRTACNTVFGIGDIPEKQVIGKSGLVIAGILSQHFGDRARAGYLYQEKERALIDTSSHLKLVPGVTRYLDALLDNSSVFAVASNSSRDFVTRVIQSHNLPFKKVVTREDVRRGKPYPDMFWHAANLLSVSPTERDKVVGFEDSPHGIRAAVSAGMHPIGITTELPKNTLLSAGAKATYPDFIAVMAAGLY